MKSFSVKSSIGEQKGNKGKFICKKMTENKEKMANAFEARLT